jgi:hypothetical protein
MYDINVALRRFHDLIKWTANWFSNPHSYNLEAEDLEAEGLLVLVRCCQRFPKGEVHFARYFKASLYSRMRKLVRYSKFKKRVGISVELDDNELPPVKPPSIEFIERMQKRVSDVTPYLSREAVRFLKLLVNPNDKEVQQQAWMELCRRHKLRSLGISTSRNLGFRLERRHLLRAYRIEPKRVNEIIREVQKVEQNLSRRRISG